MTAKVRLEPSGHNFYVEKDETLLEAGLRAGLPIQYHCSNGTCGECKGVITSGVAEPCLHHDYVINQAEKQAGTVLLCRTTTEKDLVIEASEARSADDIPNQNITTRVSKIEIIKKSTLILHLRTPRSLTLRFLAGQHAHLVINETLSQVKTIASCPCNGMILQFHFHNSKTDPFTRYLFNELQARQSVVVSGPLGKVTLDEEDDHAVIFIAYETGFSMMKSLIELAISWDKSQPMHLFWVTESESGQYYENYCRSWVAALDDFTYTPVLMDTSAESAEATMIKYLERICEHYPDLSQHRIFLNIPQHVSASGRHLLLSRGAKEHLLHMDDINEYK